MNLYKNKHFTTISKSLYTLADQQIEISDNY
jgi:hypothetical protein